MHKQHQQQVWGWEGGQGGGVKRIEVIVEMQRIKKEKSWGGGPVVEEGVRVDLNEELKLL